MGRDLPGPLDSAAIFAAGCASLWQSMTEDFGLEPSRSYGAALSPRSGCG